MVVPVCTILSYYFFLPLVAFVIFAAVLLTAVEDLCLHGESVQLSMLNKERNALEEKRIDMAAKLDSLQDAHNDLLTAKKNVEVILSEDKESQVDKSQGRSSEIQ